MTDALLMDSWIIKLDYTVEEEVLHGLSDIGSYHKWPYCFASLNIQWTNSLPSIPEHILLSLNGFKYQILQRISNCINNYFIAYMKLFVN